MKKEEAVKKWQVPSELAQVQKTSTEVLEFFKPLALSETALFDIRLCLEEALINAMKYGNRLKAEVPVELEAGYDAGRLWVQIEDQGAGFDVKKINDCTQSENLLKNGGRGVYLIYQLMDHVHYNAKGNQIRMIKRIG